MGQLFVLFLIVVGTYGLLTLLNALIGSLSLSQSLRGRISLAVFFMFTGVGHFAVPEGMAQMLPPFVPYRTEIIYVTGILEMLGAVGLLVPGFERISAVALMLFLVGVLPANIYSALNEVDFGGHVLGAVYLLLRVPFQIFLLGWAYYFGVKRFSEERTHRGTLKTQTA